MAASPQRKRVLERLTGLILAVECQHPVRIAIDGVDTAGKTTLADELALLIRDRGRTVIRASVDGFHRPRAQRYRRGSDSPEGYYLDSFDHEALRSLLLVPLGPGGNRRYRTRFFDFHTDRPEFTRERRAAPAAVLLFDGVFLQRPELNDYWDLRIFIDVDPNEVVRRACQRDLRLFGSADAARERYEKRYLPGQEIYIETVRPKQTADAVVENTNPAAPRLLLRRKGHESDRTERGTGGTQPWSTIRRRSLRGGGASRAE